MIRPDDQQSDFYGRKFYGVSLLKSPLDLWSAQEIIWECKPRTIVETGTYYGGSALYYATLLDGMKEGKVITVDIEPQGVVEHPRVTQLVGDCQALFEEVKGLIEPPVMVILDCCHTTPHVLAELGTYATLVDEPVPHC